MTSSTYLQPCECIDVGMLLRVSCTDVRLDLRQQAGQLALGSHSQRASCVSRPRNEYRDFPLVLEISSNSQKNSFTRIIFCHSRLEVCGWYGWWCGDVTHRRRWRWRWRRWDTRNGELALGGLSRKRIIDGFGCGYPGFRLTPHV